MFLEHIPFYSIHSNSSSVPKSDLTCINPFCEPNVSNTPFPNNNSCKADSFNSSNIDSQLIDDAPSIPTTSQDAPMVEDPYPRYPQRTHKSTQLPDFLYSTYSTSFSYFLVSIHHLSEPSSYKEFVLDPLWHQAMTEELFT